MKVTYYYARVSSKGQNLDRQIAQFKAMGADDRHIVQEKKSGKNVEDREAYRAMRDQMLREGDELVITSLDRLGRSKSDIKAELEHYKKENIRVRVLDIPTTNIDFPEGQEWVMEMVNNILIEVLGSIAQNERETIRKRQAEGIAAAKAKGEVKFGRPKAEKPDNWEEVIGRWKSKEITAVKAMELLNMKKSTFYKLLQEE